jgi:polygalacturonase
MKKYILFGFIVVLVAWFPIFMGAWDNTLPSDTSTWNTAAGFIRDNWDAIEGGLSPVVTVYNVQDAAYGADGSDSSDDTTAVQAAIDAAEAAGGGTIYFPPGTYELDSDVALDGSNIRLLGVPGATIINIDRAAEDTVNLQNNYAFYISGSASQDCVVIDGLEFTGTGYWGCIYSSVLSSLTGWDETGTLHTFDASTDVDITTDTITVAGHGMTQGQPVLYSKGAGTELGNISDDSVCFVVNPATNTFQLARSEASEAIDIISKPASENHTLRELAYKAAYATYRANFSIKNCKASSIYFEFANLTNVQCHFDNIKLNTVTNDNNLAAIRMRDTTGVAVTNVEVDTWTNKAISTSYCDGVTYHNITCRSASAAGDLGFYIGHFDRNVSMSHCTIDSGSGFKVSYEARDIHISNCDFRCQDQCMLQGARRVTISNCTFHLTTAAGASSQFVLQFEAHTDYGILECSDCVVSGCYISSDSDGTTENRELDVSNAADTIITGCTIRGRVFAQPARNGLTITNCDIYHQNEGQTGSVQGAALYFRRYEGVYILNNTIRNHADIDASGGTIYLHGDSKDKMRAVIAGNAISKAETDDSAIFANFATTSTIRAFNNVTIGSENAIGYYASSNTSTADEFYSALDKTSLVLGLNSKAQGTLTLWDGAGGVLPAYILMYSPNGTANYFFVEDDGTLKRHTAAPTANGDGTAVGDQTD